VPTLAPAGRRTRQRRRQKRLARHRAALREAPPPRPLPTGLWPEHGAVPQRCAPTSLEACAPRVLLRTPDYVVLCKLPDVRMDGLHAAVTMDTLARAWLPGAAVKYCHRLDYGTSGLLLGALHKDAAAAAGRAFADRTTRKTYLGVVAGAVRGSFVIDYALTTSDGFRVRVGGVNSKAASTRVTALAACRYRGVACTKVRLTPHTGRRHQLRAHLAAAGVPLVGDATYARGPTASAGRMMLHAWKLRVPLARRRLVAWSNDPFLICRGRLRPRVDPGLGRARVVVE
jgi:23S rRNA-/tRNA-specific pseudouridylate synthase